MGDSFQDQLVLARKVLVSCCETRIDYFFARDDRDIQRLYTKQSIYYDIYILKNEWMNTNEIPDEYIASYMHACVINVKEECTPRSVLTSLLVVRLLYFYNRKRDDDFQTITIFGWYPWWNNGFHAPPLWSLCVFYTRPMMMYVFITINDNIHMYTGIHFSIRSTRGQSNCQPAVSSQGSLSA